MPQAKTIELTDHFEDFIDRQLDQGSFASASEVVEAGLRLLEARKRDTDKLADLIEEGERSGSAAPFDLSEYIEDLESASRS
ncbi:MAG: type II toxin-antitoxin system ParD family antitoxin [Fulvimarina manganoxydans]|uniref:type II toxin-antitoxin system ParD family antitoxin n=1 Tax=Fulvimarina manganoxydans TaxID=937218 RepID=UPI0023557132|nr:type II toxin-antitoxin system ParD family antitoxin [Fulvimarina manganoxydans]MCK5933293.1 type II toxin-antitoxin system ParD family antitoxin [Fulvimarina manganoxydans]